MNKSLLIALLVAAGCADPVAEVRPCPVTDGGASPGFVTDREVQKIIEFYQLTILDGKTKQDKLLTCAEIPGRYRPGDAVLTIIGTHKINRPQKTDTPAVVTGIKIPANKKVVIVVEGVAKDASGKYHIVARGCKDEVQYKECGKIPVGSDGPLEIDLIATTGEGCDTDSDCETGSGMRCNKGTYFKGGYCAKIGCAKDGTCPPGAVCVSDALWGGLCARACSSVTDCKTTGMQLAELDCVCRLGPTTSGKGMVCLHPQHNLSYACPDGGT